MLSRLKQTASPHIFSRNSSSWIMLQVVIALVFPTLSALYFFGGRVVIMIIVGITAAVGSEYIYRKLRRQSTHTVFNLTAVITGYLLALSLPTTAPLWTLVLGCVFAIVIVKELGGGVGLNRFNPAVAARVMLKLFFSAWITNWVLPGTDGIATATPLESIGHWARTVSEDVPGLLDLFLGQNLGGPVGETSKIMILLAFAYLVFRKIIDPKIPALMVATVILATWLYSGLDIRFALTHALSGTLMFAAVFMATDYTSGALTPQGKIIFAIGCGLLTALLRICFDLPGGVGFSILIMNGVAPFLDRKLAPRIYGHQQRPSL